MSLSVVAALPSSGECSAAMLSSLQTQWLAGDELVFVWYV